MAGPRPSLRAARFLDSPAQWPVSKTRHSLRSNAPYPPAQRIPRNESTAGSQDPLPTTQWRPRAVQRPLQPVRRREDAAGSEGTLEGEVTVLELLAMKSTSTVQGDLYYGQLSVEAGARALGTFRMGVAEDKPTKSTKTASKADAMASLKSSHIPSESDQKQKVEA